MLNYKNRKIARKKRHLRLRKKIYGTATRPRLSVFVSNRNFYAQIINDDQNHTLIAFSNLNLPNKPINNQSTCALVGKNLGKLAKSKKIETVVFDRGGFLFHGKIKKFADAIREEGIKF